MRFTRSLVVIAALAVADSARASVIVVAPQPAPGVDYTLLQDALTAAHAGDIVLVRPGTYANQAWGEQKFRIDAGEALFGDIDGDVKLDSPVLFESHPAGGFTLLAGADATKQVKVASCADLVVIQQARVRDGVHVVNCASVVLRQIDAIGSYGAAIGHTFPGGAGLGVETSNVRAYACAFTGGQGGGDEYYGIFEGGPGLRLVSGTVLAHASSFIGGLGANAFCGSGSSASTCFGGWFGGYGIETLAGAAQWIGSNAIEGAGGHGLLGASCGTCPSGPPGQAFAPGTSSPAILPGDACDVIAPRVLREAQNASFGVQGTSGDLALLAVGGAPLDVALGALGVLHLASPTLVVRRVIAGGQASTSLTLAELGAGVDGVIAWLQAATVDAQGNVALGPLAATLLLDSSL